MGNAIRDIARTIRGAKAMTLALLGLMWSVPVVAQEAALPTSVVSTMQSPDHRSESTQDYNRRINELARESKTADTGSLRGDYQIGPEDLLEISVLEAPDLNRVVRVTDDGGISLALLGSIRVAGLSTRELQVALEDRLRQTYMKNPQVSVFVQEMKSHPVSVFGAVEKPGVYQIRYAKTLIEVLSMAQGLANDAGDTVIVERHGIDGADPVLAYAPPDATSASDTAQPGLYKPGQPSDGNTGVESITINLKNLLDSNDIRSNALVHPGDMVKVARAGIVYVVGQVHRPGGFLLKTNENISVLQAIALAEGVTPNSKGKEARIFLAAGPGGTSKEVPINLDNILAGKAPAPLLKPNDVLFVPNSAGKEALHVLEQSTAGIVGALGGAAIYRW